MSFWSALRGLAASRPGWEQVVYPYLDAEEPARHIVEVWPAGAVSWRVLGTINPQNGNNGGNRSGQHVVLEQDFAHGRFTRAKGRALCESPSKRFWDLGSDCNRHAVSCKACLRLALAHGIDLAVRPVSVGVGDLWQRVNAFTETESVTFLIQEQGRSQRGEDSFIGRLNFESRPSEEDELSARYIVENYRLVHRGGLVVTARSDGGAHLYRRSFTDTRG